MEEDLFSVRQLKAARALIGWSQKDLAVASGVSLPTIARLEAQDTEVLGGRTVTIQAIRSALQAANIEFIGSNGGGCGVLLARRS
ncbi:helix-turn-helix domain-containing protein [Ruegeria atlantica]|uniref:Helix-turn-helix domain-containing protein n=1 Tax=Ruegeria atlantica TaxID=81569 RepID=A0AA90YSA4_9RHOB|nr:helix-turn-helix domain-containing protein [Ruegeria atlantica]